MLNVATKFAPRQPAFELAYQAGFRSAEFWLDATLLSDWEQVVELAEHYPLRYALHFPTRSDLPPETLKHAAQLYRALGCNAMVIHQNSFDRFGERLLAVDGSLRLGVENHRLTPAEFLAWAERNPGLTLDVEHYWKYTLEDAPVNELLVELRRFLADFGQKLRHIHLPGYLPGREEQQPMYGAREMIYPVLSLLDEFHYGGLIVSEVNEEFQNPCDLRMDVLLFDRWRQLHDAMVKTAEHSVVTGDW